MSKPKPRITIVGLGLIGSSIGLALQQAAVASEVVGHDKEPSVGNQAKKRGAVERTSWNLVSACEESDLIILATPLDGIEPTLQAIGPYLRPGCVVMDTASVKEPVLAWADETLPDHVHFVGGNPVIVGTVDGPGGTEAARADLFQKGLFCLVPSTRADPAAVKLTADLVAILGARPLFLDPAEHDGLLAAVEHLPVVLALTLLETTIYQPAWRELRKVAGASFETSTELASIDPAGFSELCLTNRENILRWIDSFATTLASFRQSLVEGQPEEIAARLERARDERFKWLHDRAEGQLETVAAVDMPEKPNVLADAFLGGLWRKRSKQDS